MELKGYVCILDSSISLTSKTTFRPTRTDKRADTHTHTRQIHQYAHAQTQVHFVICFPLEQILR